MECSLDEGEVRGGLRGGDGEEALQQALRILKYFTGRDGCDVAMGKGEESEEEAGGITAVRPHLLQGESGGEGSGGSGGGGSSSSSS